MLTEWTMGYRYDAGERYKETRSQCRERLGIRFGQVSEKMWNPGEYRRRVRVSAGEGSGPVPEKGIELGRDAEEPPN